MNDEELLKLAKRIATIEYQEAEDVMVYDVPHSLVLDLEPLRAALEAAHQRGVEEERGRCVALVRERASGHNRSTDEYWGARADEAEDIADLVEQTAQAGKGGQ